MTRSAERSEGLSRRGFLSRSAVLGAGVVLAGSVDGLLSAPNGLAAPGPSGPAGAGYGPLLDDPAKRLALPKGFRYTVVSEAGVTTLESGEPSPTNSDGMGAFRGSAGGTVLVQNHELRDPLAEVELPVPHLPGFTYDPGAAGGTTTVHVDRDGRRIAERVSLAGTSTNCAGGVTPWQTWLTCEETEAKAGADGMTKDHGYVFEVDPGDHARNRDPQPVRALGRFAHEAVAIDPRTSQMYLTEDAAEPNGLLYRWTPPASFRAGKGALRRLGPTDGAYEAMACRDRSGAPVDDLSRATEIGTVYAVSWTAVPDRDARDTSTRQQLQPPQVTRGRKLEGCWWGDGGAYVVTSFARGESPVPHDGQVWFHDPRAGTLTLRMRFGVNPDADRDGTNYDGPDNITVSPWGGVIIAEDGEGVQHLLGATDRGEAFFFARNEVNDAEFTGPNFSADRKILFANIQGDGSPGNPGYVFAITGPFRHQG
jgi:secreted PhoX family phosphatase